MSKDWTDAPGNNPGNSFGPIYLQIITQNEWLVQEMYEKLQRDPSSVDKSWQDFFGSIDGTKFLNTLMNSALNNPPVSTLLNKQQVNMISSQLDDDVQNSPRHARKLISSIGVDEFESYSNSPNELAPTLTKKARKKPPLIKFLFIGILILVSLFVSSTMAYAAFFQNGQDVSTSKNSFAKLYDAIFQGDTGNFSSEDSFTTSVVRGNVSIVLNVPGVVINTNDVLLTPSIREPISNIFVKVGDVVSKGTMLGTLKDTKQLVSVAEARLQVLIAEKNASSQYPQPDLKIAKANVESKKIAYTYHLDQLSQTKLISPIDGMVSMVNGAINEYPLPDNYTSLGGPRPMFAISSPLPPQFEALINASDGSNLYTGKPVSIVFDLPESQVQRLAKLQPSSSSSSSSTPKTSASPSPSASEAPLVPTTFTGVISSIIRIPPAEGVKPAIKVIVDFNQKIPSINPGYVGALQASVIAASNAVLVPNEAIYPYGGLFRVNVVSIVGGKKVVTPTLVKLGVVGVSSTQILEGVQVGDEIEVGSRNK
jgi:multidrug efflux pump subunit AcrA (membrane-fusion protein)